VSGKVFRGLSRNAWTFKKLPTDTLSSPFDEPVATKIPSTGIYIPPSYGGLILRHDVGQLSGGDLKHARVELNRWTCHLNFDKHGNYKHQQNLP